MVGCGGIFLLGGWFLCWFFFFRGGGKVGIWNFFNDILCIRGLFLFGRYKVWVIVMVWSGEILLLELGN